MTAARIGLIVNPIAGVGGRVGHKGSDDPDLRAAAIAGGARPLALERSEMSAALLARVAGVELATWGGTMGERQLVAAGAGALVLGRPDPDITDAGETRSAADAMASHDVDVILFVGGDGTARDLLDAIGEKVPVIGVPAGVKMYSGVFAPHPRVAVTWAERFVRRTARATLPTEVIDLDEEGLRRGVVTTRLYGYLPVPAGLGSIRETKSPSPVSDAAAIGGIAASIAASLHPGSIVVLGPGSTVHAIGDAIGSGSTLLGVDIAKGDTLVVEDGSERSLLAFLESNGADQLIISPIGGQGFVLGRGNQQISPAVIRSVGLERVHIVATPGKLQSLRGRPLLLDTGDDDLDRALSGWRKLTVGPGEQVVYRVEAASGNGAAPGH